MQNEIWKDIPNYEGFYQVSNLGNVKTLSREICNVTGCRTTKTRLLKLGVDSKGYYMCVLYKDKHRKTRNIHQLVSEAFLLHSPCGLNIVVDHINNNRLDNRVENLQIITQRKNISKDRKNKTSKYTGVFWSKKDKKWISKISVNKKTTVLGYFKCELAAHLAYQNKLKQII